ncbi:unnamed protein product [Prorocentrum cordatum]|uniref:Uncharacterized protein n=1 Tax=Prorocentrum cordatum TaxID=2364126 RepID=A0ABN9UEK8_9DINO|nr:unnamed protein product [Polarella glacialis]
MASAGPSAARSERAGRGSRALPWGAPPPSEGAALFGGPPPRGPLESAGRRLRRARRPAGAARAGAPGARGAARLLEFDARGARGAVALGPYQAKRRRFSGTVSVTTPP